MFRCGKCGRITVPKEKATRIVTEVRRVKQPDGSHRNETAKEVAACRQCASKEVALDTAEAIALEAARRASEFSLAREDELLELTSRFEKS